jgi:hypothetical protein
MAGAAVALVAHDALRAAPSADDAQSGASCPRTTAAVLERFIDADCTSCWTDGAPAQAGSDGWLLDWITPSARDDEAPLSPAAPAEAAARARRALGAQPAAARTTLHRSAPRPATSLQLRVESGLAFNGYLAVQLRGSGRSAPGSTVWIALVEVVAPGTDGTPHARQLVRTVAGPFEPVELQSGRPWQLLQALRWPETAKVARLQARGWIEQRDGRIVAMSSDHCATGT